MRIVLLSESDVDEAALHVLVGGLLSRPIEPPSNTAPLRSRGWPAVLHQLPAIIKHLHYRTDAEGLVVVVDADRSVVHEKSHAPPRDEAAGCRLCQLLGVARRVSGELAVRQHAVPLRIAAGLAVPCIEAWYLTGRDPHVSEAAWINGCRSGQFPYTGNLLKQKVYGTDRPLLQQAVEQARVEAERIVRDGKLRLLEQLFPDGFGPLAEQLRQW